MAAVALLAHLIRRSCQKTAASALGGLAKSITPAFKAEAPAMSAAIKPGLASVGIKPAPLPALKPGLTSRIVPQPGSNAPVLRSDPALQAKSVFRAPPAPAVAPPTPSPLRNAPSPEYQPRPEPAAVTAETDQLKAQEQDLASKMSDPRIDPSSKVQMRDTLKKLYDQISAGPALQLMNPMGHRIAAAQRAVKIRKLQEAEQAKLQADQARSQASTAIMAR